MHNLLGFIYRYWIACSLLLFAAIGVLSLTPLEQLPAAPGSDKLHHFIAYASLSFPVALRKPKYWLLIILAYLLYSGLIELIQPYVNRYKDWLDMLANILGILLGLGLARLLAFYYPEIGASSGEQDIRP